jgi:hypothetical protein
LSAVVREAKKLSYSERINKSLNKNISIWNIVKSETNKTRNTDKSCTLIIQGTSVRNHQEIANEFNKYFSSLAKDVNEHNGLSSHNPDNITP